MRKKTIIIFIVLFAPLIFSLSKAYPFSIVKGKIPPKIYRVSSADYLKASVFVGMTTRDFESATGKNLNFFQRVYFKMVQHQIKRQLRKSNNPDLLITQYYDPAKEKFKFDPLWFILGAFIGPFGVLAAYESRERRGGPTRKNKLRSVWLGFALFFIWFGYFFVF
jgi:hypothetical protein